MRGESRLTLGLSSNSQVPQQEQFYTFSQNSRGWEFVTRISHLCLPGTSQVWLPPWTGHRPHMSNATFALAVPYVTLLILGAHSSNLHTEICKKGLDGVLSKR